MFEIIENIANRVNPSQDYVWERFGSIGKISIIVINSIIGIGFAISIIATAFSAIKYILATDNPDNAKAAWRTFLYGIIGAAISLGAFALKNIVVGAFGVTDPNIVDVPSF